MLSEKLLYFRKRSGLNQTSLADMIGITKQTISNWERGNSRPTHDQLMKLADIFSVSTDELLDRQPNDIFSDWPDVIDILRSKKPTDEEQKRIAVILKLIMQGSDANAER
jgi:transcriptional regulator with XRE-family HTH domain